MWVWWMMFACNLLVPAIMILTGRIMWKHCPKDINIMFGYRTKQSMKSTDTWKFAHTYCGRLWWSVGWILGVLSIFVQIFFFRSDTTTVGILGTVIMVLQTSVLLLTIIPTEKALKRKFDENGNARNMESFYASICVHGIHGGAVYLTEDGFCFHCQKAAIEAQYKDLQIPCEIIKSVTMGKKVLFIPTTVIETIDGMTYRFLIFNRKRFITCITKKLV